MALIEREALIKAIENDSPEQATYTKKDAIKCVLCMPTIDPIRAAGRCRCGECAAYEGHICKNTGFYKSETGWCNDGVPREEQDDG